MCVCVVRVFSFINKAAIFSHCCIILGLKFIALKPDEVYMVYTVQHTRYAVHALHARSQMKFTACFSFSIPPYIGAREEEKKGLLIPSLHRRALSSSSFSASLLFVAEGAVRFLLSHAHTSRARPFFPSKFGQKVGGCPRGIYPSKLKLGIVR